MNAHWSDTSDCWCVPPPQPPQMPFNQVHNLNSYPENPWQPNHYEQRGYPAEQYYPLNSNPHRSPQYPLAIDTCPTYWKPPNGYHPLPAVYPYPTPKPNHHRSLRKDHLIPIAYREEYSESDSIDESHSGADDNVSVENCKAKKARKPIKKDNPPAPPPHRAAEPKKKKKHKSRAKSKSIICYPMCGSCCVPEYPEYPCYPCSTCSMCNNCLPCCCAVGRRPSEMFIQLPTERRKRKSSKWRTECPSSASSEKSCESYESSEYSTAVGYRNQSCNKCYNNTRLIRKNSLPCTCVSPIPSEEFTDRWLKYPRRSRCESGDTDSLKVHESSVKPDVSKKESSRRSKHKLPRCCCDC